MDHVDILCHREDPERRRLFAEMLACFHGFELKVVGTIGTSLVVQRAKWPYGNLWTICDNGGELNIERVNDLESLRSIPYTWFDTMLDGATMAHRVRCVLDEDEIDWGWRMDDWIEILVEPTA